MRNFFCVPILLLVLHGSVQAQQSPKVITPPTPPPKGIPLPEPAPTKTPATTAPKPTGETRVPANYAARALLANDTTFVQRVSTAAMLVSDGVLKETPPSGSGPQLDTYNARLRQVADVMREPEFAGRKLARLVAGIVPATMSESGTNPMTTATDKEISDYLSLVWTALGHSLP